MKQKLAIALLVTLLGCGALAGCGSASSPESSTVADSVQNGMLSVGDSTTIGNWDITLEKAENTFHVKNLKDPEAGNTRIILTLTVKNNGTEEAICFNEMSRINGTNANDVISDSLFYQGKYQYNGNINIMGGDDLHTDIVSPLESKQGTVMFEIPEESNKPEDLTFVIKKGAQAVTFDLSNAFSVDTSSATDTSSENSNQEGSSEIEDSQSDSSNSVVSETQTKPIPAASYKKDEPATIGNFEVTYMDTKNSETLEENYSVYNADSGSTYLALYCDVKNNSTSGDTFLPAYAFGDAVDAELIYDGKYTYTPSVLLGYEKDLHDTFLNPMETEQGFIVFSVPKKLFPTKKSFVLRLTAGSEVVEFKLN